MTQQPALSADVLLQHEPFVRAVVRGLLTDENRVHDVVQETWLTALRRPPQAGGSLRAWLGRVASNLARDSQRGASRRLRREAAVARPEALESVATTHERLAAQRDVVSHVLRLSEPYQSVVLLRYYHDLAPAEIGERLGRSAATVRSQLSRAHEQLRDGLDREFDGGRVAWSGVLAPGTVGALGESTRVAGTTTSFWSTTSAKLAAGVIVVAAAVVLVPKLFETKEPVPENTNQVASSTAATTNDEQGLVKPKVAAGEAQREAAEVEPDNFDPTQLAELSGRELLNLAVQTQRAIQQIVLTPDPALVAANAELLEMPNTGVARLLSGNAQEGLASHAILISGGGNYYSFGRRTHSYQDQPELSFAGGQFSASGRPGLILDVGDVPLKELSNESIPMPYVLDRAQSESWSTMWCDITPEDVKHGSAFQTRAQNMRHLKSEQRAGTTYVVRSYQPNGHDHLVAFRALAIDDLGCTISWRILKSWPVPGTRREDWGDIDEHPYVPAGPAWLHAQSLEQLLDFLALIRQHSQEELFGIPEQLRLDHSQDLDATRTGHSGTRGVSRIVHRARWEPLTRIKGGGAYLSFKTGSNVFHGNEDLSLEEGRFKAVKGYIVDLGELAAATVSAALTGGESLALNPETLERLGFVKSLRTTVVNSNGRNKRTMSESDLARAKDLGLSRKTTLAVKGHTYVLRSALNDDHDHLVVFTAIEENECGFTLGWRLPVGVQPGGETYWPTEATAQAGQGSRPPIERESLTEEGVSALSGQQLLELAVQVMRGAEARLLTPDPSLVQSCAKLLALKNTGVIRLVAQSAEGGGLERLTLPGSSGRYYSVVNKNHSSSAEAGLMFVDGALVPTRTGLLLDIGDLALEALPSNGREIPAGLSANGCKAWPLLWGELGAADDSTDSEFRNMARQLRQEATPTKTSSTYLLRSLGPPRHNHVIAFRPLALDTNGCTLSWRILKDLTGAKQSGESLSERGRYPDIPPGPAWIEDATLQELGALLDRLQARGEARMLSVPGAHSERFEAAVGRSCSEQCQMTRILAHLRWEPLVKKWQGGAWLSFAARDQAHSENFDILLRLRRFGARRKSLIQDLGAVPLEELSRVMLGAAPTTLDEKGGATFAFLESTRGNWQDIDGRSKLALSAADELRAKDLGLRRYSAPAIVGHTYRLRTATHSEHDHLVVFTVIGGNEHGYTLAYRVLRTWPVPPRPSKR